MNARRPLVVTALLTAVGSAALALPQVAAGAHSTPDDPSPSAAHDRSDARGTVAQVRTAIAPFRDVQVALDAGYEPVGPCEVDGTGAMGQHYMDPSLAVPGPVDPAKPAVLLYAPGPDGEPQLLGAEFWQPAVGQPTPRLGDQAFDGPMPGHAPGMPQHYDLHVWTEVANPAGVFAPYNPKVSC